MKFVLDAEQRMFGETLDKMLAASGTAEAVRSWAAGSHGRGREVWRAVAETGVFALAVPETHGGAGSLPVELVTAFHELGRHAVPGPYVETVASAALLAALPEDARPAAEWLPRIAEGTAIVSFAQPYALDADIADLALTVESGALRQGAPAGAPCASLDPARRLFTITPGPALADGPQVREAAVTAYDLGVLACAAQQLGVGRRLLEISVEYAGTRRQFGRPIGEFQAVKHLLADALVELEFARPLVHGAALSYDTADFPRDVSAAKVACARAAYAAARTALQVHGAIGYTDEYDPSLWIRKARALYSAWGTPSEHRARVLAMVTAGS